MLLLHHTMCMGTVQQIFQFVRSTYNMFYEFLRWRYPQWKRRKGKEDERVFHFPVIFISLNQYIFDSLSIVISFLRFFCFYECLLCRLSTSQRAPYIRALFACWMKVLYFCRRHSSLSFLFFAVWSLGKTVGIKMTFHRIHMCVLCNFARISGNSE